MENIFEYYLAGESVYSQMVAPVCEKYGLTYAALTVLLFLANNPKKDTASDVVKCRGLAKSHVSVSVRVLEERGLLERIYGDGDRRSIHLRLCPQAEEIVRDGRAAQLRFGELLFQNVSAEELVQLRDIHERIGKNILDYRNGRREDK